MEPKLSESIEKKFREARPDLIRYARREWQLSHEDAEDLAHDSLTQAWRKIDQFTERGKGSFFGWVRKIMINRWKDGGKKKGHLINKNARKLDDTTPDNRSWYETIADPNSSVEYQEAEINADRVYLYRNAQLSKQEREVLYQTDVEGLKPADAAKKLNLKPTLVHKTLNRARQKMREANREYA